MKPVTCHGDTWSEEHKYKALLGGGGKKMWDGTVCGRILLP